MSSSTEYFRNEDNYKENSENSMQQLDQPYCDAVEKVCVFVSFLFIRRDRVVVIENNKVIMIYKYLLQMRRKLETTRDKKDLIKTAMDCMQNEIDRITNDHNEHLKKLFESHNAQISETKKKQWVCFN